MAKKATPAKRRSRKRSEPKSKGLTPRECAEIGSEAIESFRAQIEANGGAILGSFRDPLGGHPTLIAALPIDRVGPTHFNAIFPKRMPSAWRMRSASWEHTLIPSSP